MFVLIFVEESTIPTIRDGLIRAQQGSISKYAKQLFAPERQITKMVC
jgi:hypothetical protein